MRRRRGGKGGDGEGDAPSRGEERGGGRSCHGRRFLPEGRFIMSIPVPTFCASV